eukprot:200696-Chlamydomonas_euryale.AAC.1
MGLWLPAVQEDREQRWVRGNKQSRRMVNRHGIMATSSAGGSRAGMGCGNTGTGFRVLVQEDWPCRAYLEWRWLFFGGVLQGTSMWGDTKGCPFFGGVLQGTSMWGGYKGTSIFLGGGDKDVHPDRWGGVREEREAWRRLPTPSNRVWLCHALHSLNSC